jgi:hypothetical protein
MRRHGIKARVATIRYTNPSIQRFFGSIANQSLDIELQRPDQVWVGDITISRSERFTAILPSSWTNTVAA